MGLEPDAGRELVLRDRVVKLEQKLRVARAKLVLLTTLVRVLGLRLEYLRVPTALAKGKVKCSIKLIQSDTLPSPPKTSTHNKEMGSRPDIPT